MRSKKFKQKNSKKRIALNQSKLLKKLVLIGIPSCLGGNIFGCHKGPDVIRHKLIPLLKKKKIRFTDYGDIPVPHTCIITDTYEKCLPEIKKMHQTLAKYITRKKILAGENFPVLLGGDHSLNYAFIKASAAKKKGKLGLIWFDAHGDFNTPRITPSGNIHGMVLSALAGRGLKREFDAKTSKNPGVTPVKINEKNICIFGVRNLDPEETKLLAKSKVTVIGIEEIREKGVAKSLQKALKITSSGTEGIHLSFDLDVFDPSIAPGTGTPVKNGLLKKDLKIMLKVLTNKSSFAPVVSIDIMELNPLKDKGGRTAKLAALIVEALIP